jgi:hypothetical protein
VIDPYPAVNEGWAEPDIWDDIATARLLNCDAEGYNQAMRNKAAWEASNEIRRMRGRTRKEAARA